MGLKVYCRLFLVFSITLLLGGCTSSSPPFHKVGVDPYFYPLNFKEKQEDVNAFFNELLLEIATKEKMRFQKITTNWDNLFESLGKKEYEAIFSSLSPTIAREKMFSFSEILIPTGSVLIVRKNDPYTNLENLKGRRVGLLSGDKAILLLQKHPQIVVQYYETYALLLNALSENQINGALIDYIPAISYAKDLYSTDLKIVTAPLTDEGIRLITLKENKDLIDLFEKSLQALNKDDLYLKLKQKWALSL